MQELTSEKKEVPRTQELVYIVDIMHVSRTKHKYLLLSLGVGLHF